MTQAVCQHHEWVETETTSTNGAKSIATQCKNCGGFLAINQPPVLIDNKQKEEVNSQGKAYNDLWKFFNEEHNLTLLHGEMDDIITAVETFKTTYNSDTNI